MFWEEDWYTSPARDGEDDHQRRLFHHEQVKTVGHVSIHDGCVFMAPTALPSIFNFMLE